MARTTAYILGGLAVGVATAAAGPLAAFRASTEERRRAMPGDSIVPDPLYITTQAVTVDAPPNRVWPWLAQMGAGRAGWYSYDRIDNGGRSSADKLLPELQHVAAGDVFPATPGAHDVFVVIQAQPPHSLVLTVPAADGAPIVSWAFLLHPAGSDGTRLIVRVRVSGRWRQMAAVAAHGPTASPLFIERVYHVLSHLPSPLLLAVAGLGHRVMQNQQLRGIRRRAEAAARRPPRTPERSTYAS